MTELFDYARAGRRDKPGTPRRWWEIEVIDAVTGEAYQRVVEASAKQGWFVRYVTLPDGRLAKHEGHAVTEKVERPIIIRRRDKRAGQAHGDMK